VVAYPSGGPLTHSSPVTKTFGWLRNTEIDSHGSSKALISIQGSSSLPGLR